MIDRACIIALMSLLFFLKTITYKYSSDDIPAYNRPKDTNKFWHWFWVLEGRARHHAQADHFLTMVLHTLVCVGIYFGFGANDISFLAALLFCFNPTNNQGSVWIAGRSYVLAALGMVWTLSIPWLGPLLLLGVTYSNVGFVFPIILIATKIWWLTLFLPLAWAFHWKRFRKNVGEKILSEMLPEDREIKPEKIPLVVKTLGFYTTLALIPFKNSFYHSFLQSLAGSGKHKAYSYKDRFFWIGLIWIILGAGYLVSHIKSWDLVCFGIVWWVVGIAPFLNLCRMHQEIAERYAYLPNVGLMIILATALVHFPIWSATFLAMYATKLWFYMDCYIDDYYLVEYACLHSPNSWFAWHCRGFKRWAVGSHQEAVILWTMARMISPKEFKVNMNIATALRLSANPEHHKEALEFLKIAEDNIPRGQEETAHKMIDDWRKGNLTVVM